MNPIRLLVAFAALLTTLFIAAGPMLAVAAFFVALWVLFAFAVTVTAVVLLGERWIDEGLKDYGVREALDDAVHELVKALRLAFSKETWKGLKDDFVAALPAYLNRAGIVLIVAMCVLALPWAFVWNGIKGTCSGAVKAYQILKADWRYGH